MVTKILNNFSEPYKPSDLTAYQRYDILQPIIGEASELFYKCISHDRTPELDAEMEGAFTNLFQKAAARSGHGNVEEIRRSFLAFSGLGLPGLMSPIPLDASRVAQSFNGTWELRHRFTDGGRTGYAEPRHNTVARSQIYYDLYDKDKNRLRQLTVMWTKENHYPREKQLLRDMPGRQDEEETFLLASLVDIRLRQLDPWTVEYTDDGMVYGNHGDYLNGVRCVSTAYMMRFGASESLIGVPETRMVLPDGTQQPVSGMFILLNVLGGGPSALSFPMSGLPEMNGDLPTFDTVDSYMKVNSDRPLIGGFEPIDKYFERLRDPLGAVKGLQERSERFGAESVHGFHPQSLDSLEDYKRDY
ncbi:hypothetical protein [Puniceibacterium sediminis]|uniref:Uncharacterized protein n=1 Tax=Puniceibacterium sediminis TaxID=1608407 RepID=A0A238Z2Q2_9RHOB|nr:hypothetical protein [Puniceibacterium sediminis]SNR77630.1 hypothetical protein SAMN06265370_1234 [Puniceibacterium sediminis]